MSFGKMMFGVPGVFKLLVEPKGLPANAGDKEIDSVEITEETARAYLLTMLATGAGNSNVAPWMGGW
jgi:hypothetical protein